VKGSRRLTDEEVIQLAATFDGKYKVRNRTLFLLGCNTGLRISELLSLDVGDVWKYGRPIDIIYVQKQHTKGKLEGRKISIKGGAQKAIYEYILWKQENKEPLVRDAPLFLSRHRRRMVRQQGHNVIKAAIDACELPGHVTTHSMRKTFANKVLKASDGNLKILQELLGHRNLENTQAYLFADEDELKTVVPDFEFDEIPFKSNSEKIVRLSEKIIPMDRKRTRSSVS
jgi:site-specific recombinase XerD